MTLVLHHFSSDEAQPIFRSHCYWVIDFFRYILRLYYYFALPYYSCNAKRNRPSMHSSQDALEISYDTSTCAAACSQCLISS